jgi:hypothetical protein
MPWLKYLVLEPRSSRKYMRPCVCRSTAASLSSPIVDSEMKGVGSTKFNEPSSNRRFCLDPSCDRCFYFLVSTDVHLALSIVGCGTRLCPCSSSRPHQGGFLLPSAAISLAVVCKEDSIGLTFCQSILQQTVVRVDKEHSMPDWTLLGLWWSALPKSCLSGRKTRVDQPSLKCSLCACSE